MAQKSVAKVGDITPVAGTVQKSPAVSGGTWSAGSVTPTSYSFFTIGGVAALHAATCTFTFSGGKDTNGADVPSETTDVTITAGSTTLQKGSTFVLRDGDVSAPTGDTWGNKLEVHAANNLSSD